MALAFGFPNGSKVFYAALSSRVKNGETLM